MLRCPYCDRLAVLLSGVDVYPHRPDLDDRLFWVCRVCDAWVGCHPGTARPMGTLANESLRRSRRSAHAAFDPLWRSGVMTRKQAYTWLAGALNVAIEDCHIGMFGASKCRRVVKVSQEYLQAR